MAGTHSSSFHRTFMRPESNPSLTTHHEDEHSIDNAEFRVIEAYMYTDKSYRKPVKIWIALEESLHRVDVPIEIK